MKPIGEIKLEVHKNGKRIDKEIKRIYFDDAQVRQLICPDCGEISL